MSTSPANPTGPVHIGHARGAFMGDAISRLLDAAGHSVTREFYINDYGKQVETLGRTGVEMEALTAVSVAALTIYDMCKAIDRTMRIEAVRLLRKEGGRSGTFQAP